MGKNLKVLRIQPGELSQGVQGIGNMWKEVKKKVKWDVWRIKVNWIEVQTTKTE